MTANPEYPATLEIKDEVVPPRFIIDPEAPEAVASQLFLDEIWLLRRPATRLLALRRFIDHPQLIPEDSVWQRLTNTQICNYYGFDRQTEAAIKHDPIIQKQMEISRYTSSESSGPERALKIRLRWLEMFLERATVAKSLGRVSLQKTE